MGSQSVYLPRTQVNAPRLNPSQAGRYSICLPQGTESWIGLESKQGRNYLNRNATIKIQIIVIYDSDCWGGLNYTYQHTLLLVITQQKLKLLEPETVKINWTVMAGPWPWPSEPKIQSISLWSKMHNGNCWLQWRSHEFVLGGGCTPEAKRPEFEAKAESGEEFLGAGSKPSPHQLGNLGSPDGKCILDTLRVRKTRLVFHCGRQTLAEPHAQFFKLLKNVVNHLEKDASASSAPPALPTSLDWQKFIKASHGYRYKWMHEWTGNHNTSSDFNYWLDFRWANSLSESSV